MKFNKSILKNHKKSGKIGFKLNKQIKDECDSEQNTQREKAMVMQDILNNTTAKFQFQEEQYFLLIKKKANFEYCMLYLTDFYQNFWLEKITYEYLQEMKRDMKIQTEMKYFAEHLVAGIKEQTSLINIKPIPTLKVRLRVSQGLLMSYKISFDVNFSAKQKPQGFKNFLKLFGKNLFQAKQEEYRKICKNGGVKKIKVDLVQEEQKKQKYMEQAELKMQNMFGNGENKIIPQKNRDLINPLRKKRKGGGLKIVTDNLNESDGEGSQRQYRRNLSSQSPVSSSFSNASYESRSQSISNDSISYSNSVSLSGENQ